jgi:hypothetical protein
MQLLIIFCVLLSLLSLPVHSLPITSLNGHVSDSIDPSPVMPKFNMLNARRRVAELNQKLDGAMLQIQRAEQEIQLLRSYESRKSLLQEIEAIWSRIFGYTLELQDLEREISRRLALL